MSLLQNIASGLRSLFRKGHVDRELDEELRAYQEMAADEKVKQGTVFMTLKTAVFLPTPRARLQNFPAERERPHDPRREY